MVEGPGKPWKVISRGRSSGVRKMVWLWGPAVLAITRTCHTPGSHVPRWLSKQAPRSQVLGPSPSPTTGMWTNHLPSSLPSSPPLGFLHLAHPVVLHPVESALSLIPSLQMSKLSHSSREKPRLSPRPGWLWLRHVQLQDGDTSGLLKDGLRPRLSCWCSEPGCPTSPFPQDPEKGSNLP